MNCENYIKFGENYKIFRLVSEDKNYKDRIIKEIGNPKLYYDNIDFGLKESKIFNIQDSIKKLLILTKTPSLNEDLKLPFDVIFLDVHFTKEELKNLNVNIQCNEITGILVQIGFIQDIKTNNILGTDLNMTVCSLTDNYNYFHTFARGLNKKTDNNLKDNYGMKYDNEAKKEFKSDFNFIYNFVLNFLNFVNNPEIELIEHKRSEKNIKRRVKRGDMILPNSYVVNLTGHLKQYIDYIESNNNFSHFHYRFWVKGHYRNLISDRYKDKKKLWIFPYIKGQGILINKNYNLISK